MFWQVALQKPGSGGSHCSPVWTTLLPQTGTTWQLLLQAKFAGAPVGVAAGSQASPVSIVPLPQRPQLTVMVAGVLHFGEVVPVTRLSEAVIVSVCWLEPVVGQVKVVMAEVADANVPAVAVPADAVHL